MSVRKRRWRSPSGEMKESVGRRLSRPGRCSAPEDVHPEARGRRVARHRRPGRQGGNPHARQQEPHHRQGERTVVRELRSREARTLDADVVVPDRARQAHHPAHGRGEALGPHRADGARVRGSPSRRSLARHGAQDHGNARLGPRRCARARARRAERRAQPARKPPARQGPARRQAPEREAQGWRRHPRARRDKGDHCSI